MKEYINVWDYAPQMLSILNDGVLLTTKVGEEVDTMTIGWGHLGVEWKKPIGPHRKEGMVCSWK